MNYQDILNEGSKILKENNIKNPSLDCELILSKILKKAREEILINLNDCINDKARNQFIHVLGISKISDFFMLSFFQKMVNKYHGGRIQISTDSSSPGLYPVYGTYLHSPQLSKMTFTDLYFPKGENLPYNADDLVPNPLGHPVSEGFTFGDVSNYKGDVTMKMTLNYFLFLGEEEDTE